MAKRNQIRLYDEMKLRIACRLTLRGAKVSSAFGLIRD